MLYEAVAGFSAIINEEEGLINLDYADLRTVNTGKGTTCVMGVGRAKGGDRVALAVKQAMSCPFLEDIELTNIGRMLVHIVAGSGFSLEEYNLAGEALKTYTAEDSEIIIYKITITRMYVEKTMTLYSERRPQYSYEDRHLWVEYYPIGIEDSSEMMIAGKYSITIMPIKIKLKDLSEYGEKHE